MAKLPYMQFYPADYQDDVRCLPMASRGAWMEILCVLWRSPKRGKRTLNAEEWAREVGCSSSELSLYLTDLEHHKVGKISREIIENVEQITISSKRIMREKMKQMLAMKRKQKQRYAQMSRTCHVDVTRESQQSHAEESEIRIRNQKSEEELREEKKEETTLSRSSRDLMTEAKLVLSFLNEKTGRNYRPVRSTLDLIAGRLRGENQETAVDVQTCKSMIAKKARDWLPKPEMSPYLRPKTLFSKTNFEQYLGELVCVAQTATPPSSPVPLAVPVVGGRLRSL